MLSQNKSDDGRGGKMSDECLHEEPMRHKCFTKDFAGMVQLFRNLTEFLDFSRPFKIVIHYDPEQPRVLMETYAPIEVHEQCNRRVEEMKQD